jgi:hypothetical protein
MSSAYYPKDDLTYGRSVKVQSLTIPFYITANATPASKTLAVDEPGLLFLNVQGINDCTVAAGAFDTSTEQSAITFATPTDSTGAFGLLVRVGNGSELILKVMSVTVSSRNGAVSGILCSPPTGANSTPAVEYITLLGDKLVANVASGIDLATTNADLVLKVEYIAQPLP